MKLRNRSLFLALLATTAATAQRQGVVVDMETGTPLAGVALYTDHDTTTVTAWDGTFLLTDTAFSTLTLTARGYEKRMMYPQELSDTIALLPQPHALGEVEVWGRYRRYNDNFQLSRVELQLQQPVAQGFNPLGLISWIASLIHKDHLSKAERRRIKHQQMLDNY